MQSEETKYLQTWGVGYEVCNKVEGDSSTVVKGTQLHELVGDYDIIFYQSECYENDETIEVISRTARGSVTLKVEKVFGGKKAVVGYFKILSSTVDGDECPFLGEHLKGVFSEIF